MGEYSPEERLSGIDELFDAIDGEIRAEYQVLNKFSTEKFSIILILIGFLGVGASAWPTIKMHVDLTEFFFLWVISICAFLLYWAVSLYRAAKRFLNSEKPKSVSVEVLKRKLSEFGSVMLQIITSSGNEDAGQSKEELDKKKRGIYVEMKSFTLFSVDFVAKNTEMKMRPILVFFLFLMISSWVHLEHYFEVSILGLEQSIPLTNIPLVWSLVVYAILFLLIGLWWRGISASLSWWVKILTKGLDLFMTGSSTWQTPSSVKSIFGDLLYKIKSLIIGIAKILSGAFLTIVWLLSLLLILAFILAFPVYLPVALIWNYGIFEFIPLIGRFFIVLLVSYFLFRILEVLFSIHLIERIKNDRIAWLKRIKINLQDISEDDHQAVEEAWKRLDISELYLPMPYTALLAFTRYEIIPIFPYCGEDKLAEERLNFLNSH